MEMENSNTQLPLDKSATTKLMNETKQDYNNAVRSVFSTIILIAVYLIAEGLMRKELPLYKLLYEDYTIVFSGMFSSAIVHFILQYFYSKKINKKLKELGN